jgi:hypothetical protein
MSQNVSTAVMQRRAEPLDSLDFFPTPAWATRALLWELMHLGFDLTHKRCWEPACGEGHMARPLAEHFEMVYASDVHRHGFGDQLDFLWPYQGPAFDWIITNPPFRLAAEFAQTMIDRAGDGCAILVRTSFLEGIERHRELFSKRPPAIILQFAERVSMVKGRVDPDISSATSYCWIVWLCKPHRPVPSDRTAFRWIKPCRRALEEPGDYK